MNIATSIIFVIIMLGVLATLHELGHYWMARLLKIKVFEVSIFVGPKLLRWKHKDVDFSLRMIPVGAYVRFTEIDEEGNAVESKDPDLLINQPRIKRLIVALAGPAMNLILGMLIFVVMFWFTGFTSTDIALPSAKSQLGEYISQVHEGDSIKKVNGTTVYSAYDLFFELDSADQSKDMTLTLKSKETGKTYDVELHPLIRKRPMLLVTVENKNANNEYNGWKVYSVDEQQNNGNPVLKVGDFVTHINGKSVDDDDFEDYLYNITDEVLTVSYVRDGKADEVELVPKYVDTVNARGIALIPYEIDSPENFFKALGYAAKMPATIWNITVRGIKDAIAGKVKAYNLVSGPIGITTMVNDVVTAEEDTVGEKIYILIMLSAVISIALAFSNLLPIPGLDGIQIIFIVVEMVIGRKLSEKAEARLTVVGFIMIVLLLILAFVSDILRIILGY
ncbi:MAG: RIP metalloprotease RseP [Clostridiales bacterium]|nr:RIP metalloprotease RseP [Clostridiales bacterium]